MARPQQLDSTAGMSAEEIAEAAEKGALDDYLATQRPGSSPDAASDAERDQEIADMIERVERDHLGEPHRRRSDQ